MFWKYTVKNALAGARRGERDLHPLSDAVKQKFTRPLFWQFATLNADGWPNVKPVWVDRDGDHVLVNTGKGWRKHRNVIANPRVTLALIEPDNPYERIEIRGEVVEIIEGPRAEQQLDALAELYLGSPGYPSRNEGDERITLVIAPRKVLHYINSDEPVTTASG